MNKRGLIVAVDGHSSTGKSTVSKSIAKKLGYVYIDTGAMYRMVTYSALKNNLIHNGGVDNDKLKNLLSSMRFDFKYNTDRKRNESYLNGVMIEDEIRGMEVSDNVSLIATLAFVREVLVDKQREMAKDGGVIMDGRDIGSVVFPNADLKFFITCRPEVRAERRYKELVEKGESVTYQEVEDNIKKRDYIDSTRETSPLVQTEDAILVDTSDLTIDEVIDKIIHEIEIKIC